jgi:hypothetical protein
VCISIKQYRKQLTSNEYIGVITLTFNLHGVPGQ